MLIWHNAPLYIPTTCIMCPFCLQNVDFVRTGYGKNTVKVLVIRRQGSKHDIIELKADVELTLKSHKDYLNGDNSDIIPTDTIKNTVHALAKLKGVRRQAQLQLMNPMSSFPASQHYYQCTDITVYNYIRSLTAHSSYCAF